MSEPGLGYALVLLVAVQRGLEVLWARANTRRLLAQGWERVPRDGTAGLVVVHAAWLAAMLAERAWLDARMPAAALSLALGALFVATEALRVWTLRTLGRRWTIQVLVTRGEQPVARGPYRLLTHPNYAVVTAELLLLPLWVGAWRTALAVLLPHALTLGLRIRREEQAWRERAARPLGAGAPPGADRAHS